MTQLGKLEKVDLRKVWPHEARDFSAWLAKEENLASSSLGAITVLWGLLKLPTCS